MATLTSRSPRMSNLVILKGKRYFVDWTTGRIRTWRPEGEPGLPDYDGRMDSDDEEEWVVGQTGELIPV